MKSTLEAAREIYNELQDKKNTRLREKLARINKRFRKRVKEMSLPTNKKRLKELENLKRAVKRLIK